MRKRQEHRMPFREKTPRYLVKPRKSVPTVGQERSPPNCTMERLEGAVAGQLQCLVRWQVAWRALLPERACCTSNVKLSWFNCILSPHTRGEV
jgi:hypothetical protein